MRRVPQAAWYRALLRFCSFSPPWFPGAFPRGHLARCSNHRRLVTTAADPERSAGASLFGKEPGSANYRLNLAIRPEDLTFDAGPDGKARVALEFAAVLYDSRGKILDSHQDRATVALDPDRLRSIQASSLRVHSTVTLPASGDMAVRLLVRDLPSGRIGTLQVSAAAIRAAAVPVP